MKSAREKSFLIWKKVKKFKKTIKILLQKLFTSCWLKVRQTLKSLYVLRETKNDGSQSDKKVIKLSKWTNLKSFDSKKKKLSAWKAFFL